MQCNNNYSDKCYENIEIKKGYKETDRLGGKDPYSASKASAEIILHSYYNSFICKKDNLRISIARAGNVVGGGIGQMIDLYQIL